MASMVRNGAPSDESLLRRNARSTAQALASGRRRLGDRFQTAPLGRPCRRQRRASPWPCLEQLSQAWSCLTARARVTMRRCVCCVCMLVSAVRVPTHASARVRVFRSMRAFRVIRLFGRLGSLRDIITALTAAIIPVRDGLAWAATLTSSLLSLPP